ncbi:MAG: hypothetical protein U0R50_00965 [Gaiellales bacterium]
MSRPRVVTVALCAGFAGALALWVLAWSGVIFNVKMTTDETESWLRATHGYADVQCSHTATMGLFGWDYECRVYDEAGRYVWSPSFEVNGHEDTDQTSP